MFDVQTGWDRPCRNRTASVRSEHVLRVRLTPGRGGGPRVPAHVALALDVSGSMKGRRLERARQACLAAIERLHPDDRISLAAWCDDLEELVRDEPRAGIEPGRLAARLARLKAEGVTRADLALGWLHQTLLPHQGPRVALLVTDGHPTSETGHALEEHAGLHGQAGLLAQAGIQLSALALGDARDFHEALLVELVDRGGGVFLHAQDDGPLARLLEEQFEQAQAVQTGWVELELTPILQGLELRDWCQLHPSFTPRPPLRREGGPWTVRIPNPSGRAPTDLLFRFYLPSPTFSEKNGPRRVLGLTWQTADGPSSPPQELTLENVSSHRDEQRLDTEIHQARLLWELNSLQGAALRTTDPHRTGEILQEMRQTATRLGRAEVARDAAAQLEELVASGVVDPNRRTRMTQTLRNGGVGAP